MFLLVLSAFLNLNMASSIPLKCNEWPVLTIEECNEKVAQIPKWKLVMDNDIPKLKSTFATSNFKVAMDVLVKAGEAAETQNHHPGKLVSFFKKYFELSLLKMSCDIARFSYHRMEQC